MEAYSFRADCVHFAHSMVHEETWIDCWDYVVRWRCWGSRVGYRKSGISAAERHASHESVTGHRKDDRKLGSPMDVSIRRLGDPSTVCCKSQWSVIYCFLPDCLILQPAAWTLRPGYTRPARSTTIEATRDPETTAQAEAPEKSIFRSTKYTRILAAWLIASYPFLIPPYVCKLVLRLDRSVYTELFLCIHSSSRNMVGFHHAKNSLMSSSPVHLFVPSVASSIGLSSSQGALYSALFNIASALGRLAFGFLADYAVGVREDYLVLTCHADTCRPQNLNAWIISMASIALSCICVWPYATSPGLIIL